MAYLPRLREFSGSSSSENVSHWIRHVELLGMSLGWPDEQKLAAALCSLRGSAAYRLDYKYPTINTWEHFKHALIERFAEISTDFAEQITSRRQGLEESVQSYSDAFLQIIAKANAAGTSLSESYHLKQYILGLQSHLRVKLMDREYDTLDQAMKDAFKFERNFATPEYQFARASGRQSPTTQLADYLLGRRTTPVRSSITTRPTTR